MKRREFLGACAAGLLTAGKPAYAETVQVHYRQPPPYQQYIPMLDPGHDQFPEEKDAMALAARLHQWWASQGTGGEARFYMLSFLSDRSAVPLPGALP